MQTRRLAIAIAAGFLGLSFGTAAPPRAGADEPVPITIGTLAIDPSAQDLYAQDLGFFKAAGLDAKLTILTNAAAIAAAVAAGSLDVGFASTPGVALAHQHGIPIRFIAPAGVYTGPIGNTILMVSKASPIKSGADLAGKTIAVSALKDLTQFETSTWIDKTGGDSKSVRFIEAPYSEMAAALEQNRVDAACVIEPFVTSAKTSARILANLSATIGGPYLVGGWVSTEDWVRRNPETAKRFVAVMQKAATWANAHHKDSAEILVRYTKIRPEVALTMARTHYDESSAIDAATVQRPLDMLTKYGALAPMSARDIIASP